MVRNTTLKIAFSFNVCLMFVIVLYSQTYRDGQMRVASNDKTSIIRTVESFWKHSEAGELEKAAELTTNTYKGFTLTVKNAEPVAEWLNSSGLRHLKVAINRKKSDDMYVVRVRVIDKQQREFWLFHDVVRATDGAWKILSTSY